MQLLESSRAMPKKKLRIIGHCTRGKKLGHKANKLVLHLPVWRVSSAVTTHPFMMATVSKTRELWCRDIIYKMANFLRNLSKKHCKSPVLIPINRGETHCQSYSNIWYLSIHPSISRLRLSNQPSTFGENGTVILDHHECTESMKENDMVLLYTTISSCQVRSRDWTRALTSPLFFKKSNMIDHNYHLFSLKKIWTMIWYICCCLARLIGVSIRLTTYLLAG